MSIKKRTLIIIGLVAGVAVLLPVLVVGTVVCVAQPVRFEGTSMLPNYHDGDRLMLEKGLTSYERGDVVCFYYPRDPSKSFVKRIIGLPGEQVEIRDREIYINGVALAEPYVSPEYNRAPSRFGPEVIPQGQYFVVGDNRDHSNDSRAWGPVPAELIYGKVLFRYG
jgi:signal peptidase I